MAPDLRRDTVKLGNLLSIAEQIQAFGLGRKTGEIYITNVPAPARINMIDGEIVDAQFGMRSGMEAAVALINLADPQTDISQSNFGQITQSRGSDFGGNRTGQLSLKLEF